MLFIIHHTPVTDKGGCLWQQNNGNVKIRTPWWNISLTVTPVFTESSANTATRSSTPKPGTENTATSRLAVTRCWICGKALKSVLNVEPTPALACGEPFLPIRADARYCSNACRQKGYRQRKTIAHTSLWGTWQSLSSSLSVLLLFSKVALPILGSAKIPLILIAHSQIPKVWNRAGMCNQVTLYVTWFATPAESSSHFGNLIVAVSKSSYQNDNLIASVAEPPEFPFW